jgi:hypothetical protein
VSMTVLDLTGRPSKILSRFPTFMLAPRPDKVIADIAGALGRDLDEAERIMTRIQRAHRIQVADEAVDVLRLAALLDLQAADFFILGRLHTSGFFADQVTEAAGGQPLADQDREQQAFDLFVAELKDSVTRTIRVLFEGCGTLWALLEGTAILLDADRLNDQGQVDPGARIIEHLDAGLPHGGFVHRIGVRHHVVDNDQPDELDGSIFLVENPIIDRSTDDADRRQRERFPVKRIGFFDDPVSAQVTGVAARTVRPMVINLATHEGVGFDGALADGQKLVFTMDGTVLLDGLDVTAQAFFFRGALVDGSPLDGTAPLDVAVVSEPAHAMDRNFPRPAVTPLATLPVPMLMLGESMWRFSVEDGAFDASAFDLAVYELPADPGQLAALPPSGKVQLSWKENEPFAASVLIPAELKSLEDSGLVDGGLPTLVRAGLERFRTAGVRVDVQYFDKDWILGKSVLKDLEAPPGDGVDFNATIPTPEAPGDDEPLPDQ